MKTMLGVFALAAVVACAPVEHARNGNAAVLSPTSYGKIEFGRSLAEIERAVGEAARASAGQDDACRSVTFGAYPGMRLIVEKGIVTRADVTSGDAPADIANVLHVRLGDAFADVRARQPSLKIQPHKYDPNGHYLIQKSADGKNAVVLEESGGRISAIRAGVEPSVEYVEGCL